MPESGQAVHEEPEAVPDDDIPALVRRLDRGSSLAAQLQAAQRLDELCFYCELHPAMHSSGAVAALTALLHSSTAPFGAVAAAASAINRLAGVSPDVQSQLGAAGVIPRLVSLLERSLGGPLDDLPLSAAQALASLVHDHEANEARLVACGGVEALLRALRPGSASAPVREAALEVLGKPHRAEHKLRMLPAGGVPLLVAALRPPGTPRTPYVASVTLHNLSITGQEAKRAIAAAGALPLLVGLLQPAAGGVEDELALATRESAADALCTLAYANMDNCDAIMRIPEALPALVAMLRHPSQALRGAAVQALYNLCGHPACPFGLVEAGCTITDLRGLVESPIPDVRRAANQLVRPLASAEMVYGLASASERRAAQQEALAAQAAAQAAPPAAAPPPPPTAGGAGATAGPASAPAGGAAGASRRPRRVCAAEGCGSTEHLRRCGRCQAVRYCSVDCQRLSWPSHKDDCERWAAERERQ